MIIGKINDAMIAHQENHAKKLKNSEAKETKQFQQNFMSNTGSDNGKKDPKTVPKPVGSIMDDIHF